LSFVGFTHDCTRHRQGHCTVDRRTERKRLQSAAQTIQRLIRDRRHAPVPDPQHVLNQDLRGHDHYDGRAGNITSLRRIYRRTEKLWRKTFSRRRQDGEVAWEQFQQLTQSCPLARPTLCITYAAFQAYAKW
jgi:hypothetical protein